MNILSYPAQLEENARSDWSIVFPDVPEVVTGGRSPDEAWSNAEDALAVGLSSYPTSGMDFPKASAAKPGQRMIALPAVIAAKLFIRDALAKRQLTAADLARLIEGDHKTARRILKLTHNTRMEELERILGLLGVRVVLMAA
jgi:antitoxin HicB